jgi:tetratricopeptide (TPR) repeat protein
MALGAREIGTARLKQSVAAFREALRERTRERVPLQWAITQNNLGSALMTLGERESGSEQLGQAAAAYRAALEELTNAPFYRDTAQSNLKRVLALIEKRK